MSTFLIWQLARPPSSYGNSRAHLPNMATQGPFTTIVLAVTVMMDVVVVVIWAATLLAVDVLTDELQVTTTQPPPVA